MTEDMDSLMSRFTDEVLSRGAEALLPRNLGKTWLDRLYAASRHFLGILSRGEDRMEDALENPHTTLLVGAVMEILQYRQDYPVDLDLPEGTLLEALKCYSLWILFESIARTSKVSMAPPPTLETLLDPGAVLAYEAAHPELTPILHEIFGGEESAV